MRCAWVRDPLMIEYHDREWGVPVHDDRALFEVLILEVAQAGLSWSTISQEAPRLSRGLRRLRCVQDRPLQQEKNRGLVGRSGHCAQPAEGGGGRPEFQCATQALLRNKDLIILVSN